jgi:GNAT superfamily N-acetyltransferase
MTKYPVKINLKDGTPLIVRPLRPDDKEGLSDGFQKLSDKSKFYRFLSPPGRLSEKQLKYLTEIDYKNHMAIGAHTHDPQNIYGVGVARYIRLQDEPGIAEFAITIIDEFQGKGLGAIFLDYLILEAKKNGFLKLVGYVLEENRPMIALLERRNAKRQRTEGQLFRFELDLSV